MYVHDAQCIPRVGQNRIHTVYIRHFWRGIHQIYSVYIRLWPTLCIPVHVREGIVRMRNLTHPLHVTVVPSNNC